MNYQSLLLRILLGGLLGMLGQGIRVVIGYTKWNDDKKRNPTTAESWDPIRLWMSLLIGFVAGSLGILTLEQKMNSDANLNTFLITLIAIGYSGVDFIEGIMSKFLPKADEKTK